MASTNAGSWGRALFRATLIGTVLQLMMVIAGHYDATVKSLFAVGGMSLSLVAGFIFGRWSGTLSRGGAIAGGAFAGAACGLIGIVESYYLKDVPASLMLLGTASSAVTGAIGGFLGRISRRG
jgi:hypothetical protein